MLRALIGATVIGGALLAAGTSGPSMVLASAHDPSSGPSSFALQGDPSFGGTATMSATYAPMKWIAEEAVSCSISGTQVYLFVQTAPSTAQPWVSTWTLWSQQWADAGGASATCTATLYYYTWQGHTETSRVILGTSTFTTS